MPDDQTKQKSKITLRLAENLADLEYLRPISLEFHEESRFQDIQYSHKKRDDLFMNAINNPKNYAIIIAERDGEVLGYSFLTAGEYIVGVGDLITTVFAFFVRKKFRGTLIGGKTALQLITAVRKWSESRDVREVMIHVTSGIDIRRADRFFRKARFETIGANYSLKLSRQSKESTS